MNFCSSDTQDIMHLNMWILSLTLLILGLASPSISETCPEEAILSPCECEEDEESGDIQVDCAREELNLDRLKKSLNNLSGKKNVDLGLSDFTLGSLPSNFFSGIGIKKLEISHCPLDSLSSDNQSPLLGLEDDLEELVIMTSFTEDNGQTVLKLGHMRKLKEIDLSFNAITEVGNDWFDNGPASLEVLWLSNNGIEKVGDRAFASLVNLRQLSFDGNRFGPIKRSMLPSPAARLEKLELDNNALTAIPGDLFSNMPALKGVSLRNNGILRLDEQTWLPVWKQLNYVTLEGNPLECDASMNWISGTSKFPALYGRCNGPKERDGQSLRDYLESRKQ